MKFYSKAFFSCVLLLIHCLAVAAQGTADGRTAAGKKPRKGEGNASVVDRSRFMVDSSLPSLPSEIVVGEAAPSAPSTIGSEAFQTAGDVRTLAFPRAFFPSVNNTMTLDAARNVVFVGSFETDAVFAFSLLNGERLGELAVGDGPLRIVTHGTRAAVLNNAFLGLPIPTITVFDATDPRRMNVVATCVFPEKRSASLAQETLAFSADGQWLFCGAIDKKGNGTLYAFNARTGNRVGEIAVGPFPGQTALQKRDGRDILAVTSAPDGPGSVHFIDVTDPLALRQAGVLMLNDDDRLAITSMVLLDPTENLGYVPVANQRKLITFRIDPPQYLAETPIGRGGTRLLKFGTRMLVQEEADASVSILDVAEPKRPKSVLRYASNATTLYNRPAVSPDGKVGYLLAPFEQSVYAFDTTTGADLGFFIVPDGALPTDFLLGGTPDELRFAVLDSGPRRIEIGRALPGGLFQRLTSFETPGGIAFGLKQVPVVTADGKFAYLASPLTNEILEISIASAAVTRRIETDREPESLTLHESGTTRRLAVVTRKSGTVNLFVSQNGGDWTSTGTVRLPNENAFLLDYANVVFSRDGKLGFVSDLTRSVRSFETDGAKVLDVRDVGDFPAGLGVFETAQGVRRLAVSAGTLGEKTFISVIDASDPTFLRVVSQATADEETFFALDNVPQFNIDGTVLHQGASFSGEFLAIDPERGRITARTGGITGVEITPFVRDGKTAYATANLEGGKILILDETTGGKLKKTVRVAPPKNNFFMVSNRPVVMSDGRRGLMPSFGLASLFVFDTDADRIERTLKLPGAPGGIRLVPGSNALVTVEINGSANRVFFVPVQP